jgi:periplasmic copper chaperone A
MTINMLRSGVALAAILGLTLAAPAMADVVGSAGWSRATPPGAKEAVGYLVLTNNGDEERKLLKITSPVSDRVGIHRSTVDSQGVARMWPVGSVTLAPGESLRFEPSGLHVMFSELLKPFKAGEKIPLTLQFDGFEKPFTVLLEVRSLVPDPPAAGHGDMR